MKLKWCKFNVFLDYLLTTFAVICIPISLLQEKYWSALVMVLVVALNIFIMLPIDKKLLAEEKDKCSNG